MNQGKTSSIGAWNGRPLIVGVGASAGGLEAFTELLKHLGRCDQLAIVFVQHLDASSKSLLVDLLDAATEMEVLEINDGGQLRPGCVNVAPPKQFVELKNGVARLVAPQAGQSPLTAVDHFFHSLAEDQRENAVGIVLSGAGSDGTIGLKAISDAGGLTFAQDAASAKFNSMPRSAATTGNADHVCPPSQIAAELLRYAKHISEFGDEHVIESVQNQIGEAIPRIAARLASVTGHNFQHYKISTLTRRIRRRMQILKLAAASEYLKRLEDDEDEANTLFRELLIGVTAFFRDPDAFDTLSSTVVPSVFENKGADEIVRIWVAGCSTGEEAYSIAMLCREHADQLNEVPEIKIFATDIDERALQIARAGLYPSGIEEYIAPQRLKRFFVKRGKHYQISKEIRDYVLFSKHNLISDPPFSRQDLISCRNLLIYLGSHLQDKLIPLFHYALRPSGFLFLGPSETISSHGELFRPLDNKFRISKRKGTATGSVGSLAVRQGVVKRIHTDATQPDASVDLNVLRQRILLDEFAPKAVVIDQAGQVLNASEGVGKYLAVSGGDFQNNIIKMALSGLRLGLRAAINEATKSRRKVTHENLSIHDGDLVQRVMLTVQPMPQLGEHDELLMVVFHDVGEPMRREGDDVTPQGLLTGDRDADAIIAQMERELETTRNDLERTLQDMEAAVEELKSSNEELLSMNEELQSANEELETSKDEIRSSSDAVVRANSDLENLLRGTQIASVFLDDELRIRSFTPSITQIYELISTDVGRPLTRFVPLVDDMPHLPNPRELDRTDKIEHSVTSSAGRSFIRRVLPYRTAGGGRNGIVVTFIDITEQQQSQELFQLLVEASAQIVWLANAQGEIVDDSPSWRKFTGQTYEQLRGTGWLDAVHPDHREHTTKTWTAAIETGEPFSVEYRLQHHSGGYRWTQVRAVVQRNHDGSIHRWVGMNMDITESKRTALELADREQHLRRVIDNMLGFVGVLDSDGVLLEANAAALAAGGLSRDDVIGKTFWECNWWNYDVQVAGELKAAFDKALTGQTVRYDAVVRMAGDTRTTIDFMMVPVRDSTGKIAFVIPSGIDIEERKQTERRLIDNERRAKMTLKAGRMAAWQWTAKESKWEPALYELLGVDPTTEASTEEFFRHVHPDDLPGVYKAWKKATAAKVSYHHDFRIIRADGEVRWLTGIGEFDYDPQGNVTLMHGLNWDITEQKEYEQRIRSSEERLRLALSAAQLKLWQWDVGADRFYWTGELMDESGVAFPEPIGSLAAFLNVVHPDDRDRVAHRIRKALETNSPYRCEYRVRRTELSYRWVMSMAHLSEQDGDSPKRMVGVELDITQRRKFEERLDEARKLAEAANASKSAFLANMSHEIRTPMTAILGYVDLLAEEVSGERAQEHVKTIRRNGHFLLGIINDILDLSKIEAGKFDIERERFSLPHLIEDVRSIMSVRASEKDLALNVEYEDKVPAEIESDPKRLKQVLINLVGNAIKFTESGEVTVLVRFDGEDTSGRPSLEIDVVDTGIGISAEHLDKLFQPFSQADASVSRNFGGTGLGLVISRRLAEVLGGDIAVESTLGHGSRFTVRIDPGEVDRGELVAPSPVIDEPDSPDQAAAKPLNLRVLVVDDRRDIRILSRHILQRAGATVDEAEDGRLAVDWVRARMHSEDQCEVILLDMQMPNLDGYQTAEQLRQLGFTGPIIALTADAMQGDMNRCIEAGCNDYLSKPIDAQRMLQLLHRLTGD